MVNVVLSLRSYPLSLLLCPEQVLLNLNLGLQSDWLLEPYIIKANIVGKFALS